MSDKKHVNVAKKEANQAMAAYLMCARGYTIAQTAQVIGLNKRTIRSWFANDPRFMDVIGQAAQRASKRLLPDAMGVLASMLNSDKPTERKFAVEKILEINGFIKQGKLAVQNTGPTKIVVDMGMGGNVDDVEITENQQLEAQRVIDAEWEKIDNPEKDEPLGEL